MSKYCKICYDAGNSNYLTHNIREWNPMTKRKEIVCSYLNNLTCTNCGKKGHTVSYCTEKKK